MTEKDFKRIEDWLKVARKDWERSKRNLQEGDTIAAGFYIQQSLEKFLKAFLLLHGWKLKKIHRLDALLDEVVKFKPGLSKFNDLCEKVSSYYIADRYPPLGIIEVTEQDLMKHMELAKELIKHIFPQELNE